MGLNFLNAFLFRTLVKFDIWWSMIWSIDVAHLVSFIHDTPGDIWSMVWNVDWYKFSSILYPAWCWHIYSSMCTLRSGGYPVFHTLLAQVSIRICIIMASTLGKDTACIEKMCKNVWKKVCDTKSKIAKSNFLFLEASWGFQKSYKFEKAKLSKKEILFSHTKSIIAHAHSDITT